MHSSIADRVQVADRHAAFRRVAGVLATRIAFLLALVERDQPTSEVI
jgi:hypothetical protein